MKFTRREMLGLTLMGLLTSCAPVSPSFDWRLKARPWLRALIPPDDLGVGADDPVVWSQLAARRLDPAFALWMDQGFKDPMFALPPEDEADLLKLLAKEKFLQKFHETLLECYYGSSAGWLDLGLEAPPQPRGFFVKE